MGLEEMVKGYKNRMIVGMTDQHFPYVDERMERITLRYVRKNKSKITDIVFMGDGVDNPGMSKYPQRPEDDTLLQEELDLYTKHIGKYKEIVPNANIYVIAGNHDLGRFDSVKKMNRSLASLRALDFKKLLRESFKEQNINPEFEFGDYFKLGDNVFVHGDPKIDPRLKGGATGPRRTADTYPDFDSDIFYGHTHQAIKVPRPKSHFAKDIKSVYVVPAMGNVAKMQEQYTSYNAYQNGFVSINYDKEGHKQVDLIEVTQSPLYLGGFKYD